MNTQVPRFQPFSGSLHHFVLAILATSSIRVKHYIISSIAVAMVPNEIMQCIC